MGDEGGTGIRYPVTLRTSEAARPAARARRLERVVQTAAFEACGALIGRRFTSGLQELEQAQWLSPAELQARAAARLAPLLRHAAEHVPFYQDTYRRLGLASGELHTLDDLRRLPVVSKALFRQHADGHFLAANLPIHRRLESTTSGSTGEPFRFSLDRQALPIVFASHLFLDSWFDVRPFDRQTRIMTPRVASPPLAPTAPPWIRLQHQVTTRLQTLYQSRTQERIPIWEVDADRAEAIYRRLEAFRPAFLMGYTSTLATLADELLRRDLRLTWPVHGIITIAETLTTLRRSLIEQYFEAPIINRYGLREFNFWSAQNCPESHHSFHVITDLAIWETLRQDDTPAAPGETGRVVLTNLHNYVMPFIRYDTGDLAAAGEGPCPCGRGFPLVGPIDGRSQECVRTPSGKVISPPVLGQYLFVNHDYVNSIRHYQLVQEAPDRVRLLIVPAGELDADRVERLRVDLEGLMGEEMTVSVDRVAEIPCERSGKRPIIKACTVPSGAGNERR